MEPAPKSERAFYSGPVAGPHFRDQPSGIQMGPPAVTARNNARAARPGVQMKRRILMGRWKIVKSTTHSETWFV